MSEATIIDGKALAAALREDVTRSVNVIKENYDVTPGLAVILVGNDPASEVYVRNKANQTQNVGMKSLEIILPEDTSEEALIDKIEELNNDDSIHGILVQLPLPDHIPEIDIINTVSPEKDVDGFHAVNAGMLFAGEGTMVPCTPLGCLIMLKEIVGDLEGKKALIIGRSNIVGKPMAHLLLHENCTVTLAHSKTKNLKEECQAADIIVAAVGKPELVKGDWIKEGAAVIDVGINRTTNEEGKTQLIGDVAFEEAKERAGYITPVPGGVGPMTIACLLYNTLIATCLQRDIDIEFVSNV